MISGRSEPDAVMQTNGQLIYGIHRTPSPAGEPAIAVFSPTAVAIFTETPHSSARNTLAVTIAELERRQAITNNIASTAEPTARVGGWTSCRWVTTDRI